MRPRNRTRKKGASMEMAILLILVAAAMGTLIVTFSVMSRQKSQQQLQNLTARAAAEMPAE